MILTWWNNPHHTPALINSEDIITFKVNERWNGGRNQNCRTGNWGWREKKEISEMLENSSLHLCQEEGAQTFLDMQAFKTQTVCEG